MAGLTEVVTIVRVCYPLLYSQARESSVPMATQHGVRCIQPTHLVSLIVSIRVIWSPFIRGEGVEGGEVGRTVTEVVQLCVCAAIFKLHMINREDARWWPAITDGRGGEGRGGEGRGEEGRGGEGRETMNRYLRWSSSSQLQTRQVQSMQFASCFNPATMQ